MSADELTEDFEDFGDLDEVEDFGETWGGDDWSDAPDDGWGDITQHDLNTGRNILCGPERAHLEHDLLELRSIPGFTVSDPIFRENVVTVFTMGLNISSLRLSKEQLLARAMEENSILTITLEFDGGYFIDKKFTAVVLLDNEAFKLSWPILDRLKRQWLPPHIEADREERQYNIDHVNSVIEMTGCALSQAIGALKKHKELYQATMQAPNEEVKVLSFSDNPLVSTMDNVKQYILDIHQRCLICDEKLENPGFKPGICNKDLCGYGYETFGLGIDLPGEITNHPDLLDLQISLLVAAKRLSFLELKIEDRSVKGEEMVSILKEHCPSVEEMLEMIRDGKDLRQEFHKRHKDLYPILRWIITSNRSYIRPLDGTERIHEMKTPHQFMMVADSPEKERKFQEMKHGPGGLKAVWKKSIESVIGASNKSFYAFHGSGIGNWFTILRTGLKNLSNTKHMTNGAAHGAGIYLAGTSGTSTGYCSYGSIWEKSRFGESIQCIALCEVVGNGNNKAKYSDIYVIPEEERVITRYVFVYPKGQRIPSLRANRLLAVT